MGASSFRKPSVKTLNLTEAPIEALRRIFGVEFSREDLEYFFNVRVEENSRLDTKPLSFGFRGCENLAFDCKKRGNQLIFKIALPKIHCGECKKRHDCRRKAILWANFSQELLRGEFRNSAEFHVTEEDGNVIVHLYKNPK